MKKTKNKKVETPMVDVSFKWAPTAERTFEDTEDVIIYHVAQLTLNKSYQTIPLSDKTGSGKLRRSSVAYGVQGTNKDYTIGSKTSYAKYVWNMKSGTHWTTPGTNSQWYKRTLTKLKKNLLSIAVKNDGLKK